MTFFSSAYEIVTNTADKISVNSNLWSFILSKFISYAQVLQGTNPYARALADG